MRRAESYVKGSYFVCPGERLVETGLIEMGDRFLTRKSGLGFSRPVGSRCLNAGQYDNGEKGGC